MQKKMTKRRKALRRELKGLAFVAPAFIGLLVFTLYPMVNAVINSLYNWNMGGRSAKKFVGLYNYRKLFRNDEIYLILSNTLRYVLYILPFILVFGFLLGVLLQKKSKLNVVFRTLIYTPHVASMVGLSVVWLYIFNPQYGILNAALSAVGLRPLRWINDTSTAHMSIVIVTIWRTLGYCVVVYLGAIHHIWEVIIEAAHIDGANAWQTTWKITMPLVSPTTFMLLILQTISIMKLFTTIENMTGGGPGNATANLPMMLYDYAFSRYQMGYASAIAMVLFALILLINLIQMSLERFVSYDA